MPISLAIKKYGADAFTIEILEDGLTQKEANQREIFYATSLKTFSPYGYNLRAGDGSGPLPAETKAKISAALKGRVLSAEHRAKLSASRRGKPRSEETKAKLSRIMKGKVIPPHVREASSLASQRTFILVDPGGNRVTITNMRKFCREKGLRHTEMSALIHGKISKYRGWSCPEVVRGQP